MNFVLTKSDLEDILEAPCFLFYSNQTSHLGGTRHSPQKMSGGRTRQRTPSAVKTKN